MTVFAYVAVGVVVHLLCLLLVAGRQSGTRLRLAGAWRRRGAGPRRGAHRRERRRVGAPRA